MSDTTNQVFFDEGPFTFFWNGPFSQWTRCEFIIESVPFNCAEQYMMYKKAMLFKDYDRAAEIMSTNNPKEQKTAGRNVKGFDLDVWNAVSTDIVFRGNMAKFSQNPNLLQALLDTAGTTLVEASPYDAVWGIGMGEDQARITPPAQWKGKNLLGFVLTDVREALIVR